MSPSTPARPPAVRLPLLAFLGAVLVAIAASPQAPAAPGPSLAALHVDIWPEHDDPRVLVIYRGTLGDAAPLPHALRFPVPAGAQINAAAYRRGDQLLTARYQVQPGPDGPEVIFTVPEREFQFEYYADVITGRPQRVFALDLVFPLPVETLEVAIEQPLRATAFALSPAAARTTVAGGFTYHLYAPQPWSAGSVWRVRGSYRKEDADPSLPRPAPVPPAAGPAVAAPGGSTVLWMVPAAAGFLLGAAAVGAVWLLRRDRPRAPAGTRRQPGEPVGGVPDAPRARHCVNCGARVRPQDRFCSRCGQALP